MKSVPAFTFVAPVYVFAPVRFSVPLDKCGNLGRVLFEAGVSVCLLERTGTGWIVELIKPSEPGLESAMIGIGAQVLHRNEHH